MSKGRALSPFIEQSILRISKVFSFIVLIASVQVFIELMLRYLFNNPTTWGLELTIFLCGASYILSGGYASSTDSHIRIDLVYGRLSKRGKALMDIVFTYPALIVTLCLITWKSASWTEEAIRNNLTSGSAWDPPLWPMRLVLCFGILLLLCAELNTLSKKIRDLRNIRRPV